MSTSRQKPPADFAHLVNLADDVTGTFVLWASDEYFAEKENLVRQDAPKFDPNAYTDKGKLMDGWESQRKRGPGHDTCIIRLGTPGIVHGFVVDTTHFRGNAPTHVLVEGIEAAHTATPEELLARTDWHTVLDHTPVKPNMENMVHLSAPSARATHLRLHIFPDGGVSRLRVFGVVVPDDRVYWRNGVIDLAAVENGGTIAAVSDEFFGPPANLLLPGRGVNMGDGWETARRRTPGSDWCVIKLARRGVVERIELDTHFFKGNAPQAVVVEAIDDDAPTTERLRSLGTWPVLLHRTPLVQHRRHVLEPERPMAATHLRVHIFPHGGVNRLRVFGHALDTVAEAAALARFNGLSDEAAHEVLLSFCGSTVWARKMAALRPVKSVRSLMKTAERVWWGLDETAWREAFAAHPKIGDRQKAASATAQSATWSAGEQAGVDGAESAIKERLATLNTRYEEIHGFIYIVCATGRSAAELLAILEERVDKPTHVELDRAAREQIQITRLRLEKWLRTHMQS